MTADQRAMHDEATERVLLVSPPYSDKAARTAFLSGYETALRDIANGYLKLPVERAA
jgi:hypothetical protein